MSKLIRLNSPGPISDAFLGSRAFLAGIVGPVGSAKTMTNLRKGLKNARQQGGVFDERTGVRMRRAKVGVVRDTYPNIEKHILPSWFRIIPRDAGKFNNRAPFSHRFMATLAEDERGRAIDIADIEFEFRAIGEGSAEEACRSWELSACVADEFDLLPDDFVSYMSGRIGRFSDLDPSTIVDPQISVSLNAPLLESSAYRLLYEGGLEDDLDAETLAAFAGRPVVECFTQPGGLDEKAENLHNLDGGKAYYLRQAALNKHKPGYVDRMIHNRPVPMQHGQPVYGDFNFSEHVGEAKYDARRVLIVGVDQGLFAAAVFLQRTVMGEIRVLGEVVLAKEEGKALRKVGPTAFGKMVKAQLLEQFGELDPSQVRVVADPAAFAADDREDNEQDWLLAFQKALGFRVRRAKSNRQELRLEAVRIPQGERGGYLVDRRAKHLIRAHSGGYHYQKAEKSEREIRGHLEIANTIYTHVADAEQYAALEGEHVVGDIRGKPRRTGQTVTVESDYPMFGGGY